MKSNVSAYPPMREAGKRRSDFPNRRLQSCAALRSRPAVASSVECAALINEVSTLTSSELEEQRRQLKNRSTGAYTVLTALMLILIIILI